jgi:hypothetical protein
LVEKRSIGNESLPKVFGRRLTGLAYGEDPMSVAVMFDNLGVINRNEVCLPIEVLHGIAPVDHYVCDKCIGSAKRPRGGVDKFGLYLAPIEFVAIPLRRVEGSNREFVSLFRTCSKIRLGLLGIA